MARSIRHIDISQISGAPAWRELVDEVRTTQQAAVICADGEDVVEIRPANRRTGRTRKGGTAFRRDDALWSIVGLVDDDEGPTDVSSNKHRYLEEAYTPKPR
jgi:hypothetical protein